MNEVKKKNVMGVNGVVVLHTNEDCVFQGANLFAQTPNFTLRCAPAGTDFSRLAYSQGLEEGKRLSPASFFSF